MSRRSVTKSAGLRERLAHLRRRVGYTVIEVMMAMAILSVGATGVIAMEQVYAAEIPRKPEWLGW